MESDVVMTDLADFASYFQELLDPLLEQIFRDFDESFNGRSDTAILRTVCKNFRRIIDTSIPYFCLYRTLTDAIKQHNEKPFSSPWLTSYQSQIHSVLFQPKPVLRNFSEQHDLPEDPKDEPLLALEILLSTIRAKKFVQYHYPNLSPFIEVIYMPFVEDYVSICSWSCFVLTIPTKARRFGGKKILFQYREFSAYIHLEDQDLADYLGLSALDVVINPDPQFEYLPSYSFRPQLETKIAQLLDDDLRQEYIYRATDYPDLIADGKIIPCTDNSPKLLKYSPKSLIAALPTLPRSLYLLATDQNGDFWNNLYSCYDLIDRFRTNSIHKSAIIAAVSNKYKNSEVREIVDILCRSAEYLKPDKIYFYTPKAEKIVLFTLKIRELNVDYGYRYDELDKVNYQQITDEFDEDIAILSVQKDLNFPKLITPQQFKIILNDFSDHFFKNEPVKLPVPPPLRDGAKNLLKSSYPDVDPSAQMKSATVYSEENYFMDDGKSNNNNDNTNQNNRLIYSSCRRTPSLISDRDHYSLFQILQVDNGDQKDYYFHLRIGRLPVWRSSNEHFVHTMKVSLEEAKALFDFWSRYFTRKGLHFTTEPKTFKTVLHIERLPHYLELLRKGEFDVSLTDELVQLFPSVLAYLLKTEVIERQHGPQEAVKVIDEAFEHGTKFRAHKSVQLWNKKIELFIKAKDPINAFLSYIMSCHHAFPRKFPEELYAKMMTQLERDKEYEMQISADQLILSHIFKSANIALEPNREAMQLLNELVQDAKRTCQSNHPDILPIKEIFDIISNDVRIEFLPSEHEERKRIFNNILFGDSKLKPTDEIAVWKVHSKFIAADSNNWYWTELRQPLWLPILLTKGEFPKPTLELFINDEIPPSTVSLFCQIKKHWMQQRGGPRSSQITTATVHGGDIVPVKYIVLNNHDKRDDANADVLVRFLNLLDSRSNRITGQFIAACCNYFAQYASILPPKKERI